MQESAEPESDNKEYRLRLEKEFPIVAETREQALEEAKRAFGLSPSHFSVIETRPVEQIEGPTVEVKFYPQTFVGEYIESTDPRGKQKWEIPLEDALHDDGTLVEDRTRYSDRLKEHERAPLWIRQWSDPFYIRITAIKGVPDDVARKLREGDPVPDDLDL